MERNETDDEPGSRVWLPRIAGPENVNFKLKGPGQKAFWGGRGL